MGKDHKYMRVRLIGQHWLSETSDHCCFVDGFIVIGAGEGGGAEVGDVEGGVDDKESLEVVAGRILEGGCGIESCNFNI